MGERETCTCGADCFIISGRRFYFVEIMVLALTVLAVMDASDVQNTGIANINC